MAEQRPSLIRVILTDPVAFIAVIFPVFFWIFYFYDLIVEKNNPSHLLYWVAAVTGLSLAVVVGRASMILSIFNNGIEVKAIVNAVSFYRDRGRIAYIFAFQGQKYQGGNSVMKNKKTTQYQIGSEIDVVVDRSNPKRAIIKDLYL